MAHFRDAQNYTWTQIGGRQNPFSSPGFSESNGRFTNHEPPDGWAKTHPKGKILKAVKINGVWECFYIETLHNYEKEEKS